MITLLSIAGIAWKVGRGDPLAPLLAVAFILSQDGGIKAAMMVDERVVVWPYFEVGYTTALS